MVKPALISIENFGELHFSHGPKPWVATKCLFVCKNIWGERGWWAFGEAEPLKPPAPIFANAWLRYYTYNCSITLLSKTYPTI